MAISEKTTTTRREEIVNACEKLYKTMSFREITLKEISEETSFSRPSIYNYFATKEEIFLALFEREYDRWNDSLEEIHRGKRSLSGHALAEKLAKSLAERPQLLKLLSMNLYDMEANSRLECLTRFKHSYGKAMENVRRLLLKFRPDMTGAQLATTKLQYENSEQLHANGVIGDFELQTAKDIIFRFIMNFFNN